MINESRTLNRDQISALISSFIDHGSIVNLGIGMPTSISNFISPDSQIILTSENGIIGYDTIITGNVKDDDAVNAGLQHVQLSKGASILDHAESFALIRSGKIDYAILGAYEVAKDGSFSSWTRSTDLYLQLGSVGGAMDIAEHAQNLFIAMKNFTPDKKSRLVNKCMLPITGQKKTVSMVFTELGIFKPQGNTFKLLAHPIGIDPNLIKKNIPVAITWDKNIAEINM